MSEALPLEYKYDTQAQTLEVFYADGSAVRYFDIDPRSHFLSQSNPYRNSDFANFLRYRESTRNPVKSETIQEPTRTIGEASTKNAFLQNFLQNRQQ